MLTNIPAMMLRLTPDIASMWAVPVLTKSALISGGMLYLMPRIMPCARDACGSGRTWARV